MISIFKLYSSRSSWSLQRNGATSSGDHTQSKSRNQKSFGRDCWSSSTRTCGRWCMCKVHFLDWCVRHSHFLVIRCNERGWGCLEFPPYRMTYQGKSYTNQVGHRWRCWCLKHVWNYERHSSSNIWSTKYELSQAHLYTTCSVLLGMVSVFKILVLSKTSPTKSKIWNPWKGDNTQGNRFTYHQMCLHWSAGSECRANDYKQQR